MLYDFFVCCMYAVCVWDNWFVIGNDRMEAFLSPEGCPESPQIGDSVNQLCDGLYLKYRKPSWKEKTDEFNTIHSFQVNNLSQWFFFNLASATKLHIKV